MGNCIQKPNQLPVSAAAYSFASKNGSNDECPPPSALDTSEESTAPSSLTATAAAVPSTALADVATSPSSSSPSPRPLQAANNFNKRSNRDCCTFQEIEIYESTTPSSIEGDSFQIPLKIYQPKPKLQDPKPRAVVFFIHGGIFAQGDCHSHPSVATALASHSEINLIVVTASFRDGSVATWKSGVWLNDLLDVCDFCKREFCDKLKSDDGGSLPFGLVGSSSVSRKCLYPVLSSVFCLCCVLFSTLRCLSSLIFHL
ncbi:hypothetical protein ACHAXS_000395 [Conticribra weissflogii]